ncbi:hypothetical protein RCL1_005742 [Eukaryota sp. TZLM3-RCL]
MMFLSIDDWNLVATFLCSRNRTLEAVTYVLDVVLSRGPFSLKLNLLMYSLTAFPHSERSLLNKGLASIPETIPKIIDHITVAKKWIAIRKVAPLKAFAAFHLVHDYAAAGLAQHFFANSDVSFIDLVFFISHPVFRKKTHVNVLEGLAKDLDFWLVQPNFMNDEKKVKKLIEAKVIHNYMFINLLKLLETNSSRLEFSKYCRQLHSLLKYSST